MLNIFRHTLKGKILFYCFSLAHFKSSIIIKSLYVCVSLYMFLSIVICIIIISLFYVLLFLCKFIYVNFYDLIY